jgi:hypothetical protein
LVARFIFFEGARSVSGSQLVLTGPDFNWRYQALARFHLLERDQGSEPVIHRLFQILLAAEIAFRCQNRGVPEKKLDLLKFPAI